MKLRVDTDKTTGEPIYQLLTFADHAGGCSHCSNVDVSKVPTWVKACAQGSALLAELAIELQRPAQQEKARKVKEWAKAAGVFKL